MRHGSNEVVEDLGGHQGKNGGGGKKKTIGTAYLERILSVCVPVASVYVTSSWAAASASAGVLNSTNANPLMARSCK